MTKIAIKILIIFSLLIAILTMSWYLTIHSGETYYGIKIDDVNNFIALFSSILGVLSIFINFNILSKVKDIEKQRQKTIATIRSEIFFRNDVSEALKAIEELLKKSSKQDLVTEVTLQEIVKVRQVCQSDLIKDKVNDKKVTNFTEIDNMYQEILKFKANPGLMENEYHQIASSRIRNFSNSLITLKNLLNDYIAEQTSDAVIKK